MIPLNEKTNYLLKSIKDTFMQNMQKVDTTASLFYYKLQAEMGTLVVLH